MFEKAETEKLGLDESLVVVSSSDRGLCGGVHSSVSKATRSIVTIADQKELVILGDKSKAQLQRVLRSNIKYSFNQIGKQVPTFMEACAITDEINSKKYEKSAIIYNQFKSVIAFEASKIIVYNEEALKRSEKFTLYEVEDDVLDNLVEFSAANAIYWAMVEGHAAEMAAKRTAMENATKNAGEMIDRLTLSYNRGRQAVITNELSIFCLLIFSRYYHGSFCTVINYSGIFPCFLYGLLNFLFFSM